MTTAALTLVIGNKNYSSWSLRPWLAMRMAGLTFAEVKISLYVEGHKQQILRYSPSGKVPCLIDHSAGDLLVWDSLAICEYINERYANQLLWPSEAGQRAQARSLAAEMHAGFAALRQHLSMDIRADHSERGQQLQQLPDVAADIARIQHLFKQQLEQSQGPFLFGGFCIADAFFAPVLTRFRTYGVALSTAVASYSEQVLSLAPMLEWDQAARQEPEVLHF